MRECGVAGCVVGMFGTTGKQPIFCGRGCICVGSGLSDVHVRKSKTSRLKPPGNLDEGGGHHVDVSWVNYNDLTRPHPKWWFMWGIAPQPPYFRLVKYYNALRCPPLEMPLKVFRMSLWITIEAHSQTAFWMVLCGLIQWASIERLRPRGMRCKQMQLGSGQGTITIRRCRLLRH